MPKVIKNVDSNPSIPSESMTTAEPSGVKDSKPDLVSAVSDPIAYIQYPLRVMTHTLHPLISVWSCVKR